MVLNPSKINKYINTLNSFNDLELKEFTKKSLLNDEIKGGLGLAQVAKYLRPSPLKTKIISIDEENKYFYIEVEFIKN